MQVRSVLFVEHTPGGMLAGRLREVLSGLEHILGFKIKVVERGGASLKSKFPLNTLWEGVTCPRPDCITCTQGTEKTPMCTRRNLLYENICALCNPGAGGKGELKGEDLNTQVPSVYVESQLFAHIPIAT